MNNYLQHKIPAKVMLVGEYGVVAGGSALTIPFHDFHAHIRDAAAIPADRFMWRRTFPILKQTLTVSGLKWISRPDMALEAQVQ